MLPRLFSELRLARQMPVRSADFDAAAFEMYQSAELTLATSSLGRRTVPVAIPIGACGRPWDETVELVRWRCGLAFGERGEAVWAAIMRDGGLVAEVCEAALG